MDQSALEAEEVNERYDNETTRRTLNQNQKQNLPPDLVCGPELSPGVLPEETDERHENVFKVCEGDRMDLRPGTHLGLRQTRT